MVGLAPAESRVAVQMAVGVEKGMLLIGVAPEQQAVVGAMVDAVNQRRGEDALRVAATEFKNGARTNEIAEQNVLTDVDPISGKPTERAGSNEAVALQNNKQSLRVYQEYLLKGIDNLVDDPLSVPAPDRLTKVQKQNRIALQIHARIMASPALKDALFDPMLGMVPPTIILDMMRDRGLMNELASVLNEATDPTKMPGEIRKKMLEARSKRISKDGEATKLAPQEAAAKAALTAAEGRKTAFEGTAYVSATQGAVTSKEAAYVVLDADIDVQTHKAEMQAYEKLDRKFQSGKALTPGESTEYGRLAKSTVASAADPKVIEYNSLATERANITRDYEATQQKHADTKQKLDTAKAEKLAAQTEENDLTVQLQNRSSEFSSAVDNALGLALDRKILNALDKILPEFPTLKKDASEKAQELARMKVKRILDQRWIEEDRNLLRPREKNKRVSGRKASEDFRLLLDKGPDGLIEAVLNDPSLGVDRLTADEITMLKGDNAFMDNLRKTVPATTIRAYLQSGKRFSENELKVIGTTSWGQNMVDSLISQSADAQKVIDAMKKDGKISDTRELFRKAGWSKYLLIILIALGLFVAGPTLIGMFKGA